MDDCFLIFHHFGFDLNLLSGSLSSPLITNDRLFFYDLTDRLRNHGKILRIRALGLTRSEVIGWLNHVETAAAIFRLR
jgi:hypothetical protein